MTETAAEQDIVEVVGAHRLRKDVALVQEAAVLAAHGKEPARRTADDQVDSVEGVVLEVLDVAYRHIRPMADRRDRVLLVVADGVAGVRVLLDHRAMAHLVAGRNRPPARPRREQLDRFKGAWHQPKVVTESRSWEATCPYFENVGSNRYGIHLHTKLYDDTPPGSNAQHVSPQYEQCMSTTMSITNPPWPHPGEEPRYQEVPAGHRYA